MAWLERLSAAGHLVVMVSDSARGRTRHTELMQGSRLERLKAASEIPADLYLYVSDNNDEELAFQSGFCHVHPKNFRMPER